MSALRRDVEWEGPDVWFAHCCMLDDAEMHQFAENGIGVSHCPSSNLRLASGNGSYPSERPCLSLSLGTALSALS